jgi:hypothetical protein
MLNMTSKHKNEVIFYFSWVGIKTHSFPHPGKYQRALVAVDHDGLSHALMSRFKSSGPKSRNLMKQLMACWAMQ